MSVCDLCTAEGEGTKVSAAQVRETNDPASASAPAWSPDGTKLAFVSVRDRHWEIYVTNADGSRVTRLTNHPAADYGSAWSPVR